MSGRILLLIAVMFSCIPVFSQTMDEIRSNYESFEYGKVIQMSNHILKTDSSLTETEKLDLYTMKGVSFYSTAEIDSARASFIDLLKISPEHQLDPVRISPKIISFYNMVKSEFEEISEAVTGTEEQKLAEREVNVFDNELFTESLFRSIILPGLGHLHAENNLKNWLFTTVSAANLGTMIYYIVETNTLEKKYLNETNLSNIAGRYKEYNDAYKVRNILIGTYAAIWLYSQIDILFNSDDLFTHQIKPILSFGSLNGTGQIKLGFKVKL